MLFVEGLCFFVEGLCCLLKVYVVC